MTVGISLVALLGIVIYLLVRSGELRTWHVILTSVFGFYLARTHLGDPIGSVVVWVVTGLTHTA
ncbi:hypothetical protein E6W39_28255 [Kitasatospora acidiphila]|uniref:Uncharacterized protein n=1 Tax=Kitasatospora acidiphila TaxID=2567942 RepID=A0A540W916_9ACTN|nr:hypothetical protein [Kitasatospora acidiphila]TQF05417.1 hypothetical protein E6W39_28255 [Kitasatospora acidiphila]